MGGDDHTSDTDADGAWAIAVVGLLVLSMVFFLPWMLDQWEQLPQSSYVVVQRSEEPVPRGVPVPQAKPSYVITAPVVAVPVAAAPVAAAPGGACDASETVHLPDLSRMRNA